MIGSLALIEIGLVLQNVCVKSSIARTEIVTGAYDNKPNYTEREK
ncbi:MAG: hypothetical protein ACJA0N_001502 [Pseudohongiellaceae bacterium]